MTGFVRPERFHIVVCIRVCATAMLLLTLNPFVGSTETLDNVRAVDVQLVQVTNHPWDGKVAISITPTAAKRFAVHVGMPGRSVIEHHTSAPNTVAGPRPPARPPRSVVRINEARS